MVSVDGRTTTLPLASACRLSCSTGTKRSDSGFPPAGCTRIESSAVSDCRLGPNDSASGPLVKIVNEDGPAATAAPPLRSNAPATIGTIAHRHFRRMCHFPCVEEVCAAFRGRPVWLLYYQAIMTDRLAFHDYPSRVLSLRRIQCRLLSLSVPAALVCSS